MQCSNRIREKVRNLTDASLPCPQDRLSYIGHNYTYRGRIVGLRYTQTGPEKHGNYPIDLSPSGLLTHHSNIM